MNQVLIASSVLLWVTVLFNFLLLLVLIRRLNAMSSSGDPDFKTLDVGQRAPDFAAQTLEGSTITLSDCTQRALMLVFVSPNCGPCRDRLPELEALTSEAGVRGIDLVLVSNADMMGARDLVNEFNLTMPVLVAPSEANSISKDYKVAGTPFYCLVENGRVKDTGILGADFRGKVERWKPEVLPPRSFSLASNTGSVAGRGGGLDM